MAKSKYTQGVFRAMRPEKYVGNASNIVYRSSWELKLMHWCDDNPSVINWMSEEIAIPYYSQADGKMRRYYVDFIVKLKTVAGTVETVIIEVKPFHETVKPKKGRKKPERYMQECYTWQVNNDKWAAARVWAEQRRMKFIILDEYSLGLKKKPSK